MAARSKAQQHLMGMAYAMKKGELPMSKSKKAAKAANSMNLGDLRDFASTKASSLPPVSPQPQVAPPPLPPAPVNPKPPVMKRQRTKVIPTGTLKRLG